MPCTYTGSLEGDALLGAKDELDMLTRLLCEACKHLDNHELMKVVASEELFQWWIEHAEADRRKQA